MKTLLKYLTLAATAAALAVSARAIPTLVLYDVINGVGVTVSDNGLGGDAVAGDGIVTFSGTVGNWVLNVSTGIVLGTLTQPNMHLNSVDMSTSGAGWTAANATAGGSEIQIMFSGTGFGPSIGGGLMAGIGGTGGGGPLSNAYYSVWDDPLNGVASLGPTTAFTNNVFGWQGPLGPGAFAHTDYGALSLPATYSITALVDIFHAGTATQISSFDVDLRVPDSAMTAMLLGLGLLGVGAAARRFRA